MSPAQSTLAYSLGHNTPGKVDIAVQSVLLAIGFVVVGLRLWSRRSQRVPLRVNDWLIIVASFIMTGLFVVEILMILLCGLGLHATEVSRVGGPGALVQFKKLSYSGDLLWVTVVALIQLSILHYYLCIIRQRIITWLTYGVMALCLALWMASLLAIALFCMPPRRIWLADTPGHCGNPKMLHMGCAASVLILDMFILAIPIPVVWNMHLAGARKFALLGIFALGLIINVITAIRIRVEFNLDPDDPIYNSSWRSLFSSIVPLLGIIVACLPVLLSSTHGSQSSSVPARYWKTRGFSAPDARLEEPEIPLVAVRQPATTRAVGHLAQGQIHVTSDWEIHSMRDSARLDRGSVRQIRAVIT